MSKGSPENRGFLAELRRRKVIRVALVYAVVAWLLIQVAETTFDPLNLPDWTLTLVVMLVILGFPLAIVLAWAFELTPDGIRRDPGASDDAAPDNETTATGQSSVAVLPFADMSPAHDQAYFCEGVAEEILNVLARFGELKVASRTSSFSYRESDMDVRKIGQELQVGTVLEGSVRKAGDKLRVNAQLVDVDTGYHLWSERFDREMEDIFAIQDEIAANVAQALETTMTPSECECASQTRRSTSNARAYDLYLKGWSFFHRFGKRNMRFAVDMFERAIEEDPKFARAWAGLADALANLYVYFDAVAEYRRRAREASEKALELCPDLAESNASAGLVHVLWREWPQAESRFEKAMELDPTLYEAPFFYARACMHQGKTRQAAELFDRASKADPENYVPRILGSQAYAILGEEDAERRRLVQGIELAERHLRDQPDDIRALYLAAGSIVKLGDIPKAIEMAERAMRLEPEESAVFYNVACVFSQAGEIDRALDCLEKTGLPAMANLAWVESDPDLLPLHGQPRFEALLDTMRTHERRRAREDAAQQVEQGPDDS